VRRLTVPLIALVVAAACQLGGNSTQPVPSVSQLGSDLKCSAGDHPFEDNQAGWGFCYPGSWQYIERSQSSTSPPGLDLTFNVTDVPPCVTPSFAPGQPTPKPICPPNFGLYAFMIISTYERGDALSLAAWVHANLAAAPAVDSISWGNAVEAGKFADGRRIAMTAHHVVILDMHSGTGMLDLETQMGGRLSTWKFTY
jgi:hypothetical protein